MLKRQFSRREKILLVIFAILLLAVLYYALVDQPVRSAISDATVRRDTAESQLLIDTAKLQRMHQMQEALATLNAESSAIVPDYDNARQVVNLLNRAMLYTESYNMSFDAVSANEQIVYRTINISFLCSSYSTAEMILSVLHDGPYCCQISSVSIVDNDSLETGEFSSVAEGGVKVTMTVTFYEFIPSLAGDMDLSSLEGAAD